MYTMDNPVFLSIVIPTLNRYSYLTKTLEDFSHQSFQNFEILIVDQTDKNKVQPVDFKGLDIRYVWSEIKSASLARNIGLSRAKGDVVLFLDDDIIIDHTEFLDAHIKHYKEQSFVGVSGAILNKDKAFRSQRHPLSKSLRFGWLFFPINYNKQSAIFNGWAGNLSVRTNLAKKIGGMDQRFEKGAFREESDFCYRLCSRFGPLLYEPDAYIIHIGAAEGGLRQFSTRSRVRNQHHFDGMFYFLFKNIPIHHYPFHLLSFFLIFFKRKTLAKNPLLIFLLLYRTFKGIYNGIKMTLKGPIYLDKNDDYFSLL